jgi:hypothetical protein
MRGFDDGKLSERLGAADAARKAQLERFRNRATTDDPEMQKRRAERAAIVAARETRQREKEARRREEEARQAEIRRQAEETAKAEAAAREAAAEAERLAREAARPRQAIRDAAMYAMARAAGSRR